MGTPFRSVLMVLAAGIAGATGAAGVLGLSAAPAHGADWVEYSRSGSGALYYDRESVSRSGDRVTVRHYFPETSWNETYATEVQIVLTHEFDCAGWRYRWLKGAFHDAASGDLLDVEYAQPDDAEYNFQAIPGGSMPHMLAGATCP